MERAGRIRRVGKPVDGLHWSPGVATERIGRSRVNDGKSPSAFRFPLTSDLRHLTSDLLPNDDPLHRVKGSLTADYPHAAGRLRISQIKKDW
jgi:hypothetical protein